MSNKKFFGLKYDSVFKNVFYRDEELLKKFLSDILSIYYDKDVIVKDVTLLNLELTKDRFYIKNKTVDIRVDTGYRIINCEINLSYDKETEIRNFCFLTQALNESIKKGDDYVNIKDHIQFNFNFMGVKAQGIEESRYENITTHTPKFKFIKTIDINVDYFMDTWYNSGKEKEYYEKFKSIIMFGLNDNELKMLKDEDDYMKKVKKEVLDLNQDPEFYQRMTDEEDRQFLYNSRVIRYKREGLEEGIKQGSKEKEIEIVRNMKEKNYPIEDIKEITGLSIEEIEKI